MSGGEKSRLLHARGSYGSLTYVPSPSTSFAGKDSHPKAKRTLFSRRDCILVTVVMLGALLIIAITLGIGLPHIHNRRAQYFSVDVAPSDSILHTFQSAALVSDGEPCAPIGKNVLEKGGSAVDAAIAMVFCGGVVNPISAGLGGGFLMTIYNSSNHSVEVIDAREEAPSLSSIDMFLGNSTLSRIGGLSIAVPGELRGLGLAHQRHGKLNWSELVLPAAKLCEDGFVVSAYLAERVKSVSAYLLADPGLRMQFIHNVTGELFKEGELMKRPQLGATLEEIARSGHDILYNGTIADTIAEEIRQNGGIITSEDLSNYQPILREAVSMPLAGGRTFLSAPAPGSGAVLASILNILEGYKLTAQNVSDIPSTVVTYQRMIEAFKFAFAQRTHLGDPKFVDVVPAVEANMTSAEFGAWIRSRITDDQTHEPAYYGADYMTEDHGTAHCSVLASNGDAVSVTSTINHQFGSKVASPSTGIIFNNEMDDFSSPNITNLFGLAPSSRNLIQPGKRPLSSMSPGFILDDNTRRIEMVFGANGGTRIITAIAKVLSEVMWFGKDVKQAIDEPRFHHQLIPDLLNHEAQFQEVYIDNLRKLGHKTEVDSEGSVVLGIVRTEAGIQANVDYRKGGSAEGL